MSGDLRIAEVASRFAQAETVAVRGLDGEGALVRQADDDETALGGDPALLEHAVNQAEQAGHAAQGRLTQALKAKSDLAKEQQRLFGRLAERAANALGTPKFLIGQTAICASWMGYNKLPEHKDAHGHPTGFSKYTFDRYPFMLLTLALSLQAAYAAPFILVDGNRKQARADAQADVDEATRDVVQQAQFAHLAAQDRQTSAATKVMLREISALRDEVRDLRAGSSSVQTAGQAELAQQVARLTQLLTETHH